MMRAERWIIGFASSVIAVLSLAGCGEELPPPSGSGDGYQRVVLAELFTAVWCGNCKYAEEGLDRLFDEEGPARIAVIHWHPSIGSGDPFAFPFADQRVSDYQDLFGDQVLLPLCIFNGLQAIPEGTAISYEQYRRRYELEAELLSVARITLEPLAEGNALTATVAVDGFPGGAAIDADLIVALVEHEAPNPGVTGPDTLSYVARAARSEPVAITPGATIEHQAAFTLDPTWKRRDLYLVAFLQETAPAEGQESREVLQAAMTLAFPEEQPFYGFLAAAPDTNIGIPTGGGREIAFTVTNTGTLGDRLTIDLPAGLQQIPGSWSATLRTPGGAEVPPPTQRDLLPGEVFEALRISVGAPAAGSGTLGLVVSSTGSPALVDTLTFHLEAGEYGFTLNAADSAITAVAGRETRSALEVINSGTLADSLVLSLPAALAELPAAWSVQLADAGGTVWPAPHTLALPTDPATVALGLAIMATEEGSGSFALVAQSQGDPSLADTLRFAIAARVYDFVLRSDATQAWAVVGTPKRLGFEIENRGARDDFLEIDLPAGLQSVPEDWQIELTYAGDFVVPTPHSLIVEAGQTVSAFGVRVAAGSAGTGGFGLVVASQGDLRLADTLAFAVTADAYGFELQAPGGTALSLTPPARALVGIEVANTGTVNDLLVIDAPGALSEIPAGWQVYVSDADSAAISLPRMLAVEAGAVDTSLHLYAAAPTEGEATISLVAASSNLASLTDTLTFTLTAASSDYALELTPGPTVIPVTVESYAEAHFTIENTGTLVDTVLLLAESLEEPHPWGPPTLCRGSECFPPFQPVEVDLSPGQADSEYYVDIFVATEGAVHIRLSATSNGDPAVSEEIIFTFTTEQGTP